MNFSVLYLGLLDMFGAGVQPSEMNDRYQHTGELYKNRAKIRTKNPGSALRNFWRTRSKIETGIIFPTA
jgi:hypothetical protein